MLSRMSSVKPLTFSTRRRRALRCPIIRSPTAPTSRTRSSRRRRESPRRSNHCFEKQLMDFLVPKLSATMESVKVLRWLKRVGDNVAMGEPLVELETDKAAMEVESPVEATLEALLAAEGVELPVGAVLARLGIAGDAALATSAK